MSGRGFRKGQTAGRGKSKRLPKPLVLIVCEGKKTEPYYFKALRQSNRIQRERIRILTSKDCKGNDPLKLVRCAKKEVKESNAEKFYYDEVWCVFDCL